MSNYNSLKTTINTNIKQNGRQEITGQILNSVLNQMVNILGTGYQFAGVATIDTNPGAPDAKVFYIANGKGTYTNFSGIEVTEDDVVVLYWDSSWHKVSTGIASQAKLSELKEKIDALALGAFYGFFPDFSFLPVDVTTPGYAYVGLDNPYKIWNFNGKSWSDSGTSIDMNDADEEDITRNVDGKLQFKDRAYGDGMGYVILRKDMTFASQITQMNTIYEIRYEFDLNGANVSIPDGCVLKFEGGKVKNGSLNVNKASIQSPLIKIFDESLTVIGLQQCYVEWFGAKGDGESNDTTAFQNALNASIYGNLVCSKKYNITSTININKQSEERIPTNIIGGGSIHFTGTGAFLTALQKYTSDINIENLTFLGNGFNDFIHPEDMNLIRVKISGCHFSDFDRIVYSDDRQIAQTFHFYNNTFVHIHKYIIDVYDAYDVKFVSNIVEDDTGCALCIRGHSYSLVVSNNLLEGLVLSDGAIKLNHSSGLVITNNYFEYNKKDIVFIDHAELTGANISSNTCFINLPERTDKYFAIIRNCDIKKAFFASNLMAGGNGADISGSNGEFVSTSNFVSSEFREIDGGKPYIIEGGHLVNIEDEYLIGADNFEVPANGEVDAYTIKSIAPYYIVSVKLTIQGVIPNNGGFTTEATIIGNEIRFSNSYIKNGSEVSAFDSVSHFISFQDGKLHLRGHDAGNSTYTVKYETSKYNEIKVVV